MRNIEANDVIEKFPDAETYGFFWCNSVGNFCCVVLAHHPTVPRMSGTTEFSGETVEALIANAECGGFLLGDVAEVERSCLSAPCSPRPKRSTKRIARPASES